jgi:Tfp pilus assembly protein PilV
VRRGGFTFLEVLFSVIIIGIGFIMVAAIFPVAIQQTQSSVTEAAAIAVGRDAIRYLQISASSSLLPATGTIGAPQLAILPSNLTTLGNQLANIDHRYSWVGLYRRDMMNVTINGTAVSIPAAYIQVWIIVAQSTAEGQPAFSSPPVQMWQSASTQTLNAITGVTLPFPNLYAGIPALPGIPGVAVGYYPTTSNQYIEFPNTTGIPTYPTPAAPGAYVVIAASADTTLVGQVLRLGTLYAGTTWNLLPGNQMNLNDDPNVASYSATLSSTGMSGGVNLPAVFILGRPPVPPVTYNNTITNITYTFSGPAQDVACVTGFVRLSN